MQKMRFRRGLQGMLAGILPIQKGRVVSGDLEGFAVYRSSGYDIDFLKSYHASHRSKGSLEIAAPDGADRVVLTFQPDFECVLRVQLLGKDAVTFENAPAVLLRHKEAGIQLQPGFNARPVTGPLGEAGSVHGVVFQVGSPHVLECLLMDYAGALRYEMVPGSEMPQWFVPESFDTISEEVELPAERPDKTCVSCGRFFPASLELCSHCGAQNKDG